MTEAPGQWALSLTMPRNEPAPPADSVDAPSTRVPGAGALERAKRAAEYLSAEHNLDGQHDWYDRKATASKRWHMRLGFVIITCGAAVSVVQVWTPTSPAHWTVWTTAGLGALIVIAKAVDRLWSFDENWAAYRRAAESIKRERRLYVNEAGPYTGVGDEEAAYRLLVERIEDVVAVEERTFWQPPASARSSEDESRGSGS